MALQHLRSSTANKRPTPASMADGQLALNSADASPGLFFKNSVGTLVKAGPVHVGTTAPNSAPAVGGQTGNSTGELWLDTSLTPNELKTWNGTAWVSATGQEIPVSKLINGSARQLLQTDAAGTDVEWTSDIDVPGTFDVTGAATFDSSVAVSGTLTKSGNNVVTVGDTGTVTSTMIADGTIVDGDISASAAIADTKLSTISTAGKVSGSAITSGTIGGSTAINTTGTITTTGEISLKEIKETVYTLGTTGTIALDPANGSIQSSVLTGAPTFTDSLASGQTIVLHLEGGATYTVTWPTITWVTGSGNTAPTLTAKDTLVLWKISTTLYGAYVGSYV